MALTSPQELQRVAVQKEGTGRFQNGGAPKISDNFIQTLDAGITSAQKREAQAERDRIEYLRTDFQNKRDDARIRAQAEVTNARGVDSIKQVEVQRESFRKEMDEVLKKIPSQYHAHLKGDYDEGVVAFNKFAVPFQYKEVQGAEDDAYKTRVMNTMNDTVEGSADLANLNVSGLLKVAEATRKLGIKKGLPPEQTEYNVQNAVSETVRRAVEQQAKIGSIEKAARIYHTYFDKMSPDDKIKGQSFLDQGTKDMEDRMVLSFVNDARRITGDNLQRAHEYLQKVTTSTGQYTKAISVLRGQVELEAKQKQSDLEARKEAVQKKIDQGIYPAEDLMGLPSDERNKIINQWNENGGANRVTNMDVYATLRDRFNDTNPRAALNTKLLAYKQQLSPQHYEMFETWQNRLKKGQNDEVAKAQQANDPMVTRLIDKLADQYRIRGKQKKAEFEAIVRQRYNQLLVEKPSANQTQIRNALTNEAINATKTEKYGMLYNNFGIFPNERTVPNPDFAKKKDSYVHPSVRDLIKRAKPNWSEQQINSYINEKIQEGVDVSSPRY